MNFAAALLEENSKSTFPTTSAAEFTANKSFSQHKQVLVERKLPLRPNNHLPRVSTAAYFTDSSTSASQFRHCRRDLGSF